jgi:hypothetical protein
MKCPGCGVIHVEEMKFCDCCGARLTRRPLKSLLAAFAVMVISFLGGYLLTTGLLSLHENGSNGKAARPLTTATARAVKNYMRPVRGMGAAPAAVRPAARMAGEFAVARADNKPAAVDAATPAAVLPEPHVAGQAEGGFELMRDPLNAEK